MDEIPNIIPTKFDDSDPDSPDNSGFKRNLNANVRNSGNPLEIPKYVQPSVLASSNISSVEISEEETIVIDGVKYDLYGRPFNSVSSNKPKVIPLR